MLKFKAHLKAKLKWVSVAMYFLTSDESFNKILLLSMLVIRRLSFIQHEMPVQSVLL